MSIPVQVADLEKIKFKESSVPGQPGVVVINPDGTSVGGKLVPYAFDYVAATYPTATSEVYTFKSGGSGGTTVATVTVTYTTSSKALVSSVTRT